VCKGKTQRTLYTLISLITLATALGVANAQGAASIWTAYDNAPSHYQNQFLPGQMVYIFWSPMPSNQHIQIFDQYEHLMKDFGIVGSEPVEWQIPPDALAGTYYYIVIPGPVESRFPIAVATVHVLPEISWGPLTGAALAFGAFGMFIVYKSKLKK
jgi:hypothetical protein